MKYVLGIDQSTQGSKVCLFDEAGNTVCQKAKPHQQIINELGYVSHNVKEIYHNIIELVEQVIKVSNINPADIVSCGISNQRETTVIFDSKGNSYLDAIVWQCNRATKLCENYVDYKDAIKEKTGLEFSPYFPLAKARWLLDHVDATDIHIGTIDTYLVYRLTGNFYTDYSNASRTQMFNIKKLEWDEDILNYFDIKRSYLPEVLASDANYGETDFDGVLDKKIPITAVLGDSHAALFGHGCLKPGLGKVTYGTGSSIMINSGSSTNVEPGVSNSIGFKYKGEVSYVYEGNINYTGAIISWLKNDVHLINDESEIKELIENANPKDRTVLIPAFSGLGSPYFNNTIKASILNMDRNTRKNEIVKAGVEAIALEIDDVVKAISNQCKIESLRADGGPTKNTYLMQFESNLVGCPIKVFKDADMSIRGAAIMAGISIGLYDESIFDKNEYITYEPLDNSYENEVSKIYHHYLKIML